MNKPFEEVPYLMLEQKYARARKNALHAPAQSNRTPHCSQHDAAVALFPPAINPKVGWWVGEMLKV